MLGHVNVSHNNEHSRRQEDNKRKYSKETCVMHKFSIAEISNTVSSECLPVQGCRWTYEGRAFTYGNSNTSVIRYSPECRLVKNQ